MPFTDWQFYFVTAAALWGGWQVLRPFASSRKGAGSPCGGCAVGNAACAKASRQAASASSPSMNTSSTSESPLVVIGERRLPSPPPRQPRSA